MFEERGYCCWKHSSVISKIIRGWSLADVCLSTRATHTILFTYVCLYFQLNKPVLFTFIRNWYPDALVTLINPVYFSFFCNMFISNLPVYFYYFPVCLFLIKQLDTEPGADSLMYWLVDWFINWFMKDALCIANLQ